MEPLWSLIVGIMDIFEGSLGGQGSRQFCKPYKSLIKSLPNRLTKPFTESYKTLDGLSGLLSNQGEKSINFMVPFKEKVLKYGTPKPSYTTKPIGPRTTTNSYTKPMKQFESPNHCKPLQKK